MIGDHDLRRRAMVAYFRTDGGWLTLRDTESTVVEHAGKRYAVLTGTGGGVLAVYRVLNRGELKRLKRWPVELGDTMSQKLAIELGNGPGYGDLHKAGCRDLKDPEYLGVCQDRAHAQAVAEGLTGWGYEPDEYRFAPCVTLAG